MASGLKFPLVEDEKYEAKAIFQAKGVGLVTVANDEDPGHIGMFAIFNRIRLFCHKYERIIENLHSV